MIVFIYTIADPISKNIVYVGMTRDVKRRQSGHYAKQKTNSPICNYLNDLRGTGLKPIIEIIDECQAENSLYFEMYWIHQCFAWGFNLLNKQVGRSKYKSSGFITNVRPTRPAIRLSLLNNNFLEFAQERAAKTENGNLSNYINRLILNDFQHNGGDIKEIL